MDQPIIQIQELNKTYGKLHVLRNLNLDVYLGQRVALIGPSGSGKSTVLRMIMGLDKPDSGIIKINGERLWQMQSSQGHWVPASNRHVRNVRKNVGMVFQHFNLFPHRTVLENVTEAPIYSLGRSREEATESSLKYLSMVGLRSKIDSYPAHLSGGQKQRVAIARALAMEPKVMLFDEVTSALDPELTGEVLSVLRDLATQRDVTMILVTHEMDFASEISDRVCFFSQGSIIEDGTPDEVLRNPKNERTQQFLSAVINQ